MIPRTPNYRLNSSVRITYSTHDTKIIEAGTFVRPIQLEYVPKHVTENPLWKGFDKEKDVFCYCSIGIISIPKKYVQET